MGKLIRLELFNFKSYKGHHVMLFGNSYFTSIIGPNGSGKSNSMDAISFVLGIKSSHLRSSHLRDLVYRGRVLAQAEIGADGGVAENGQAQDTEANGQGEDDDMDEDDPTSQQTNGKRSDPTTAWVMAVYEDDAGDEQAWKRAITASGTSEYRINNRVVTAKDYNDALEAEQILIKARNFLVFQGDVEAIASQSSKDLTRLIEQISGSLEYKPDYDRLSDESERAIDTHNAKLKHRRTLNAEAKQYQEQKDEADKYQALQRDYDQAVVDHVLWKLYHLQKTIDDSAGAIQRHQDELKELLRNSASDEKRTDAMRKEQASAARQLTKADEAVKKQLSAIEEKENNLLPINEKLDLSNKKIKSVTKRVDDIEKERQSQQQAVDKLVKDLANVQKAQTQWEAEYAHTQQQSGRDLSAADLQEYDRIRSEVSKQTVSHQGQIDGLGRRLQSDQEMVASLKSQTVSGQSHVSRIEAEVAALESRAEELTENVDSLTMEIGQKRSTFNSLQSQRVKSTQRRAELEEKLQEILKTIAAARANRQETEKEARFRDTISTLKRLFPGVLGPLSSLVKPKQKKYAVAVATALGRNSDAIVVETEKIANNCIQHLKNQRTSRETFIPLDTVVHKSPDSSLRGAHPGMRLVMDTIEYDSSVERAVAYAVADTIVCDSTQIARQLCYDRKIDAKAVTLEGTVISKGGNMTGGQGPDQRNAQKFEESHIENAHRIKDKLLADITELPKVHQSQDQEESLQGELSGLEARLLYAKDELKALNRNIDSRNKEFDSAQSLLDEAQRKYDQHAPNLTSLQQQLDQATGKISAVEDKLFSSFCQRLGYTDIRVYERLQGSMQRDATTKKLEFANQKSRIENQKSFEQQRLMATKQRIKKLEDEAKASRLVIEDCMAEKETLNEELDELRGELDGIQEKLDQIKATHSEKGEQLAQHRREVKKREAVIENTTKASDSLQQEVTTADLGRLNLLKQCRMKAIDLPLQPGSRKLDALPQGDEEEDEDAMDVDATDIDQTAINDHGILIDFDKLDDDFKDSDSPEQEKDLLKDIEDLNKQLESKAPNSRAVERLDSIKRRVKDQEAEFLEAQREMNRSKKEFEEVRDKRFELFSRAYEHISNRIDTVYKDLTRTESFQLGGSASLTLEGDEDAPFLSGIKYHAMPPLKRFRDMEHLSGGEKTMAALALLFAIHNYIPSPFFVLDEVDAALDNANTAQLADYLRSHARPGMQFVVISLKATLFQNSETLVGIMRDQKLNSSRALTLDLRRYRD